MRIFLSYASEDRSQAEDLALALRGAGHRVFFDRDSLPAGEEFHTQIAEEIESCDSFVFLVSPSSITSGAYTLTELKLARQKWAHPMGHVLPVMLTATALEDVPAYLQAVNILQPEGSLSAEVVARLRQQKREKIPKWALVAIVLGIVLGIGALQFFGPRESGEAAVLTRLEMEAILQRHRPSIESCIKPLMLVFFLDFVATNHSEGGLNLDIHTGRLATFKSSEIEFLHPRLKLPREFERFPAATKLSASHPRVNACILGVVSGDLSNRRVDSEVGMAHRYITEEGAKWVRAAEEAGEPLDTHSESFFQESSESHSQLNEKLLPIYFEYNSAVINKESIERLKQYSVWLKEEKPKHILIEGHINENTPAFNIPLSEKRAESVKEFLVHIGLNPEIIETIGLGATKPAKDDASPYNDRAEIKLTFRAND